MRAMLARMSRELVYTPAFVEVQNDGDEEGQWLG